MAAYNDILLEPEANDALADFVREKIRETVRDPDVAERLTPHDHPIGTKRICVDTDYYTTFNRANVTLVDLRSTPIEKVGPAGIATSGKVIELDAIVFATGFDAMTGAIARIAIRGRDGTLLREKWEDGPRTYLGIQSAGFPNLFLITGPGSPSVLSNMVVSIEQHVEFVADLIAFMAERKLVTVEALPAAEGAWVAHVNDAASKTLYPRANSWYVGANVPGKPRVYMPYVAGVGASRRVCDGVAANQYEGFVFGSSAPS